MPPDTVRNSSKHLRHMPCANMGMSMATCSHAPLACKARACVCVCVCMCVCLCVCACVFVCGGGGEGVRLRVRNDVVMFYDSAHMQILCETSK